MKFKEMIETIYFNRKSDSIKTDYGRTLLIGGSVEYPNAILISASLAGVSGCGYITIGVPQSIYPIVATKSELPCTFLTPFPSNDACLFETTYLNKTLQSTTSILFGNGIRNCEENKKTLTYLLHEFSGNLIIDATGIELFSQIKVENKKPKILLTPHLGEAKKLFSTSIKSRNPYDYEEMAKEYCKKNDVNILLKSNISLLVDSNGTSYSSEYGSSPSLAKAGSGDGLAGYLAGLLAYATKTYTFPEIILFGDKMIHHAAKKFEDRFGSGLGNILTAKMMIESIIKESQI